MLYTVLGTNSYRAPGRLPCVENPGMNGLEGAVSSMVEAEMLDGIEVFFTSN